MYDSPVIRMHVNDLHQGVITPFHGNRTEGDFVTELRKTGYPDDHLAGIYVFKPALLDLIPTRHTTGHIDQDMAKSVVTFTPLEYWLISGR